MKIVEMAAKMLTKPSGMSGTQSTCDSPSAKIDKRYGKCDNSLKKTQKSMYCNVCNYWFCFDCSHVSNKLCDVLMKESTAL